MKTFDQILSQFLTNVKIRVKDKTYSSYKGKAKVFSEWLTLHGFSETPLAEINEQTIEQFSIYLANERKLDKSTCQKYFIGLRQVFKYAMVRSEIKELPFNLFVLPQKGKDCSAQVIPRESSKILLEDIRKHDKQLYLACMMEYYTFLRPGKELRLLKVRDIDFNKGTISVSQEHAKNGHKRIVTVPSQLSQILSELRIDMADKDLYVFGRNKKPDNKPCGINMLGYRFRKYRDRNGLSDGYKLYSMKHQGCSLLHAQGNVSMLTLMTQLGHSSLSASQHYLHRIGGAVDQTIKTQFPNPY